MADASAMSLQNTIVCNTGAMIEYHSDHMHINPLQTNVEITNWAITDKVY